MFVEQPKLDWVCYLSGGKEETGIVIEFCVNTKHAAKGGSTVCIRLTTAVNVHNIKLDEVAPLVRDPPFANSSPFAFCYK